MIAPFLPNGSSHGPLPADRLEFVPDLLDSPLHRLIVRVDPGLDLLELSAADERAAVRMVATLDDCLDDPMARGRQEGRDLSHVGREGNQEDVQQLSEGGRTVMNVSSGN